MIPIEARLQFLSDLCLLLWRKALREDIMRVVDNKEEVLHE